MIGSVLVVWGVGMVILLGAVVMYSRWDFARPADVIIVLGASVDGDGSPGQTLDSRIEHAVTLWRRGLAQRIICTGGYTGQAHRSESSACRATLIALGVPDEAIHIEEHSQNTYENAQHALEIMAENDLRTAVVVSSGYHLLRARWLFWRAGQPVHTSPAGIAFLDRRETVYAHLREVGAFHWQLMRDVLGENLPHVRVPVP